MPKKIIKKTTVKKSSLETKIQKALDKVRPALQMDGGDVELIAWDEKKGELRLRLTGHCAHCPMSQITLQQGIAKAVVKAVPEVKDIIAV